MIQRFALWSLAIGVILGQMVRFPLPGQSGGLLVSDVAVILVLLVAGAKYLVVAGGEPGAPHALEQPHHRVGVHGETGPAAYCALLYSPFILWSLFTLVIHLGDYLVTELAIAGAYWLRTSSYLLLVPALVYLTRSVSLYTTLHQVFITMIVASASLGGLQILFFPDLATLPPALLALSGGGWDPHAGRVVATWLDPNFFGAFVSIALPYCLGWFFLASRQPQKIFFLSSAFFLGVLLIMTQSRSSLVALALAILLLSPLIVVRLIHQRERALVPAAVAIASVAATAALLAALTLGERLVGLLTFDPTVQFRLDSLVAIWRIASEHSLVGIGYNAWQFVAQREGLISDLSLHSRAGADNSWLTLLVTTGVPGLLLFVLPWLVIGLHYLRRWLMGGHVLALVAVGSLLTLTIHSQFVNSWLYAHLFVVIAIIVVLANPPRHDPLV